MEAAWLDGADGGFSLMGRRFAVPGQPFLPQRQWAHSPSTSKTVYGDFKRFTPVQHADGREGVVWQDMDSDTVKLTWLSVDLLSSQTVSLMALPAEVQLVGAVGDGLGTVVLLLGDKGEPSDQKANSQGELVKFDAAGNELQRVAFPVADVGLYSFFSSGASLVWLQDTISITLTMKMIDFGDGVNHQGATNIIFNATTLEKLRRVGAGSHTWATSLKVSEKDDYYLGMILGDAYPRGIMVSEYRASSEDKRGRVIYQPKILHRVTDTNPAGKVLPVYQEISTPEKTYYQWSKNDNAVYTELAHPGLHEVNNTVLVFFAGEDRPLDNSAVGALMNTPRCSAGSKAVGLLALGVARPCVVSSCRVLVLCGIFVSCHICVSCRMFVSFADFVSSCCVFVSCFCVVRLCVVFVPCPSVLSSRLRVVSSCRVVSLCCVLVSCLRFVSSSSCRALVSRPCVVSSCRTLVSYPRVVFLCRILVSCLSVGSSRRVFMSCPRVVSWSRVPMSCPRVVSSCRVLVSCPRVVSSRRVVLSHRVLMACLHVMSSCLCRLLLSCPHVTCWSCVFGPCLHIVLMSCLSCRSW